MVPLLTKPSSDPTVWRSYCQITTTRFLAKDVEHEALIHLNGHCEGNSLFHDFQSGFRSGRGTELALSAAREHLLSVRDAGGSGRLMLLELLAAFDTDDHTILVNRLQQLFGISGRVLNWFQSFL